VDEKKQPLEELVYLIKVCLARLLLPLKLGFWAYSKHLVSQPIVLKYSVKQPCVAALLKLVCVTLALKEVPALSVGTVWRHEKVGRIVMAFRCLPGGSIYNVGASL
jgi:hypothetical protein